MSRIDLECVERKHKGDRWSLELAEDGEALFGPDGETVAEMSRLDFCQRFVLPSALQNVRYLTFLADEVRIRFKVMSDDLRQIKGFVDRSIASGGPEAMDALRGKAFRDLIVGGGCIGVGLLVSFGSFVAAAASVNGGRYTVWYGVVIFGVFSIGRGLHGLRRCGEIKRLEGAEI